MEDALKGYKRVRCQLIVSEAEPPQNTVMLAGTLLRGGFLQFSFYLSMQQLKLLQAIHFAAQKHRHQRRKDADAIPYINHPIQVATQLAEIGAVTDTEVLMGAILHDTLEDTDTTPEELEAHFGARVRSLVEAVTDDKRLPKQERKRLQIDHAATLDPDAVLIKISDKIANVKDIAQSPPQGWELSRQQQYLDWAAAVVNSCPMVNEPLEAYFQATIAEAKQALLQQV